MKNPQLIYAANDTRSAYFGGRQFVRHYAGAGSVSALDFSVFPPKVCHLENVPLSVIGPPTCLDGTREGNRILVAAAMTVDPKDRSKLAYDNKLTLLRWKDNVLTQLDQIETGLQPSGVTLNREGTHAYVTLRAEGAIAEFDLSQDRIVPLARTQLTKAEDSLCHFAVSPDGTVGIATMQNASQILIVSISAKGKLKVVSRLDTPKGVYSASFHPSGKFVLVNCPFANCVTKVAPDAKGRWKVGKSWPVGHVPEGVEISPDGRWAASACFDGSNADGPEHGWWGVPAHAYVFAIDVRGELTPSAVLPLEKVPQSAIFTPDSRYLLAGQYGLGNLAVFRLNKGNWEDTKLRIDIPGQSAALRTALS